MAHFAEIDQHGTVLRVLVIPNSEQGRGNEYLKSDLRLGGSWVQASYNTRSGIHLYGGTPLRFNYPGFGWTFSDAPEWAGQGGAFIPPQPFPSWVLNPDTALWDAPVSMPTEGGPWRWDEDSLSWVEVTA